jgi:hypothetical protein
MRSQSISLGALWFNFVSQYSHFIFLGYINNLFEFCQCKVRLFKEAVGKIIGIALLIKNFPYTGIDKHFKADTAGQGGTEEDCTIDADAVKGRLDDGILFCMKATT